MKNIFKLLAGVSAVIVAASCSTKVEYKTEAFVLFPKKSITALEDQGQVKVPVIVRNLTKDITLDLIIGGTAVKDVDFTVEGDATTMTLSPSTPSDTLVLNIINDATHETGQRTVQISFSLPEGAGYVELPKACTVAINDVVVIDWSRIEGLWAATDYFGDEPDGTAYPILITKKSETACTITGLWGCPADLDATVTFAPDRKSATISISSGQYLVTDDFSGADFGDLLIINGNDEYPDFTTPVEGAVSASGITIGPWDLLATGNRSGYKVFGELYQWGSIDTKLVRPTE